jgi:hypothetical protein
MTGGRSGSDPDFPLKQIVNPEIPEEKRAYPEFPKKKKYFSSNNKTELM